MTFMSEFDSLTRFVSGIQKIVDTTSRQPPTRFASSVCQFAYSRRFAAFGRPLGRALGIDYVSSVCRLSISL